MSPTDNSPEHRSPAPNSQATSQPTHDFAVLLTDAQSALYCYICNLLGNARDARDVLQETNVVLLSKTEQYDTSKPFMPWAYRIAHFQVLSHRKRLATDRLQFSDRVLEKIATEVVSFNDTVGERIIAIEECVPKLPPSQREIVLDHYRDGQSIKSIAARETKSENAISAILYRARRAIVQCVQQVLQRGRSS